MRSRITSIVAIEALWGLLAASTPNVMAADRCNSTQQIQLVAPQSGYSLSGWGLLVVNNQNVEVLVRASNLTPGNAYTAWFIYADQTAQCLVPNHCAPPDLIMPPSDPEGVFGRMDGGVAGSNGQLTFRGMLHDFQISEGSAVHIAIFDHGPANTTDGRARARQLLTPEAPGLGAPGLGVGTQKGFPAAFVIFDIASCK
jgi:hypothetical protein